MVTSKRHLTKFYLILTFGFLFFISLGFVLIHICLDNSIEKNGAGSILLLLAILVFIFPFYILRIYIKNAPRIMLNKHTISFGKEQYNLDDIKKIELIGKVPFRLIIDHYMEGVMIVFKNKEVKYIYDDMYANTWQIKSFLERTVLKKEQDVIVKQEKLNISAIDYQSAIEFKGNQFLSYRGAILWLPIFFITFHMLFQDKAPPNGGLFFLFGAGIFWFLIYSWGMHYFGLTNDFLIVKNHNLLWRNHVYRLSDIKQVTFESFGEMPNSLRVTKNNYESTLYQAGTLNDKTWLELKKRLQKHKIKVINNCIY